MEFKKLEIKGLVKIIPSLFEDERGTFFESYNKQKFAENGIDDLFFQDNISISKKYVLRGMHFQTPPYSQKKLVSVIKGKVLDVVVDLRSASPTFGKYEAMELSGHNHIMLLIPEGFAHGFYTLEENTVFSYKCSTPYHQPAERSLLWNDKQINIKWPITKNKTVIISQKDQLAKPLSEFKYTF